MFRRWFIGRNGPDQLSLLVVILAAFLSIIPWAYIWTITTALLVFAMWRMFSRNIEKRRKENLAFLNLVNRVKTWYYKTKTSAKQRKYYKVFRCPQCRQKLRVPRGKGKVSIKCSKCGNRMIRIT